MKIETDVSRWIDPGEQIVWSGRPNAGNYAIKKSVGSFWFGVFFFGFAVFWVNGAYYQSGLQFALYGAPIVIAGLAMLLSPLWHFIRGRRTTYLLTDRRAIIDTSGLFPKRLSVPLSQVRFVELKASNRESGDILFRDYVVGGADAQSIKQDGFIAISDATYVDRLVRTAIDKMHNTSSAPA